MLLLRFLFMPRQELAVVGMEVMDLWDGDKEIGTDVTDLALHVALLVASVGIAELHAAAGTIHTAGSVESFFFTEPVKDPLGRMLLLLPDVLVFRQPR